MKLDPDFAPKMQAETRWWRRAAIILWSVFFLLWGGLFLLAWLSR